jgi:phosphoglycerate dehydrogenase-like enzyme
MREIDTINEKKMNVVVTEPEYKKAKSVFSLANINVKCIPAPEEESLLAEKIISLDATHIIVGAKKYVGPLYDALPKGGLIARFGVGHDGIDKKKIIEHSLYLANTPNVLEHSVAELTIALIMMSARHLVDITQSIKNGQWQPQRGSELKDKTLAIIGCGSIGNRVAQIASFGLQMKVIGNDTRELDIEWMNQTYGFESIGRDFDKAVAGADFVSLHLPLKETTNLFINAQKLRLLSKSSWLINTSRGAIVDESALFKALQSGMIAGAALDVFMNEPYEPVDQNYDLRLLNNVIFTPHIGSSTNEANRRMAERCLRNIEFALKGEYEKMDLVAGPERR